MWSGTMKEEEESVIMNRMKGPAFVLWDVMTCPLPTEEAQIRGLLRKLGSAVFDNSPTAGGFRGYPNPMCLGSIIPPDSIIRLLFRQISFICSTPATHVRKMISHLRYWAKSNPAPATYLVISGDQALSSTLMKLRSRNYNILVGHPDGHSDLAETASCVWAFPGIILGEPPYLVRREMVPRIFTVPQPKVATFVLWDVRSCPLPTDNSKYYDMVDNIYSTVYTTCSFTQIIIEAVGLEQDTPTDTSSILNTDVVLGFNAPETHVSDMIFEMEHWAANNPVPANILVISGVGALSSALEKLHSRKYNILVAHPEVYSADVVATAILVWHYKGLVRGEPPYIVHTEVEMRRVDEEPSELPPASIVRPNKKKRNYPDKKKVPKAARSEL